MNFKIHDLLRYLGGLIFILFMMNIILAYTGSKILNEIAIMNQKVVKQTINEFNEIDLSHLCNVTNCSKIWQKNKLYINDNHKLISSKNYKYKYSISTKLCDILPDYSENKKHPNYRFSKDFEYIVLVDDYNLGIVINLKRAINEGINMFLFINLFIFILYSLFFIIVYTKNSKKRLIDKLQLSNTLQEKNMKILTENIHHELNTPLAVINGTLEQYEYDRDQECKKCPPGECKINRRKDDKYRLDLETIYSNIDQIKTVLQRMNGFKQIKYSNGNKTLADIIDYSINSMSVYKRSNFTTSVSTIFKKYSLSGKLSNGDFLNIFSNFLRNSLDAKATFIRIEGYCRDGENLYIYITDNGEGIYDRYTGEIIQPKYYNRIFEPYYSSKDKDGNRIHEAISVYSQIKRFFNIDKDHNNEELRGVGLYLNKELLQTRGGNLRLKSTSKKGTVFEVMVQIKPRAFSYKED